MQNNPSKLTFQHRFPMNRWSILFLLFVSRLGMGFQFQSVGSVGTQLSNNLGFSNAELGALIGIFMLPGIFLAFPSGWLGRWIKDKVVVSVGLMCLSFGGVFVLLSENLIMMGMLELFEDKSDLTSWGGYNYQNQSMINKIGTHIIDDLMHIGVNDDNEIFQVVKAVYMSCTNKAKDVYCVENTEALKDWVGN